MFPLICPVCGDDLVRADTTLTCPRLHSFDIAKEGYSNLLLSRKTPKIPGDDRFMLLSRRNFLERGHFKSLLNLISLRIQEYLSEKSGESCIAEIGSGEGYYIGHIRRSLEQGRIGDVSFFGMDLSRDAARLAAKRYREITFFVADVWGKVLFRDESVSVLLDIFAPRNVDEFSRALVPEGLLLIVIPGPQHLAELRAELPLLKIEADKEEQIIDRFSKSFRLERRQALEYEINLTGPEVHDLVSMTPNCRHLSREDLDGLNNQARQVTASFIIMEFRKLPHPA